VLEGELGPLDAEACAARADDKPDPTLRSDGAEVLSAAFAYQFAESSWGMSVLHSQMANIRSKQTRTLDRPSGGLNERVRVAESGNGAIVVLMLQHNKTGRLVARKPVCEESPAPGSHSIRLTAELSGQLRV
jgi:hypothetical protein